jgi:hypothetical protein
VSHFSTIAVAGDPGVGKTTWIREQLTQTTGAVYYWCPGTESVEIDATRLSIEFPALKLLTDGSEAQLMRVAAGAIVFLELGFHLDLATIAPLMELLAAKRVALVSPDSRATEWHEWADQIVEGATTPFLPQPLQLWRSPLSGQILDPASLEIFWYELTEAAYGQVQRAKGIFEVADGRSFDFDFVAGLPPDYTELDRPRWLKGRPDRSSGVEVMGTGLDEAVMVKTLSDCCLPEAAIVHYQAQLQQHSQQQRQAEDHK